MNSIISIFIVSKVLKKTRSKRRKTDEQMECIFL